MVKRTLGNNSCALTHVVAVLTIVLMVLLMMVTAARLNGASAIHFDENKFFSFMGEMDKFSRAYGGCPPTGFPPAAVCDPARAHFDAAEWSRIERDGARLFAK